jgi:hypothetical protein
MMMCAIKSIVLYFLAAALMLSACSEVASDETSGQPRYTGNAAWTIHGVRPGDQFSVHDARLGKPAHVTKNTNSRTLDWNSPYSLMLEVNDAGEILWVAGESIKAGDIDLISPGMGAADISQVLGPGKVQRHMAGRGFVIDIFPVEKGRTISYVNQGVSFTFHLQNDSLKRIQARKEGTSKK